MAIADGDHIYAVIKGSAACHGGKAKGFTVPSDKGQVQVIRQALKDADVDPSTISYIELHGTGTSLGDPIEVKALKEAFQSPGGGQRPSESYCGIGSVKSNLGHLESASGIAGLIKVVLQMIHRKLLASIHIKKVNSFIRLENSPFYVVTENKPWERLQRENTVFPRRAGVSSFGLGGTLTHVVVEEYLDEKLEARNTVRVNPVGPKEEGSKFEKDSRLEYGELETANSEPGTANGEPVLIVLSAKKKGRLKQIVKNLHEFINHQIINHNSEIINLNDIAYTLQVGREAMRHRVAFLVVNLAQLRERLEELIVGKEKTTNCFQGQINSKEKVAKLLTFFESDEELNKALNIWAEKGKVSKLAEFWTLGVKVNWHLLYGERKPLRISLPTYPFAKERYWIGEAIANNEYRRSKGRICSHAQCHYSTELNVILPVSHLNLAEICYKSPLSKSSYNCFTQR